MPAFRISSAFCPPSLARVGRSRAAGLAASPAEGPAALVLRPWKVGGREEEGIGERRREEEANHRSTDDGLGRSDPKFSEHFLLSKT